MVAHSSSSQGYSSLGSSTTGMYIVQIHQRWLSLTDCRQRQTKRSRNHSSVQQITSSQCKGLIKSINETRFQTLVQHHSSALNSKTRCTGRFPFPGVIGLYKEKEITRGTGGGPKQARNDRNAAVANTRTQFYGTNALFQSFCLDGK